MSKLFKTVIIFLTIIGQIDMAFASSGGGVFGWLNRLTSFLKGDDSSDSFTPEDPVSQPYTGGNCPYPNSSFLSESMNGLVDYLDNLHCSNESFRNSVMAQDGQVRLDLACQKLFEYSANNVCDFGDGINQDLLNESELFIKNDPELYDVAKGIAQEAITEDLDKLKDISLLQHSLSTDLSVLNTIATAVKGYIEAGDKEALKGFLNSFNLSEMIDVDDIENSCPDLNCLTLDNIANTAFACAPDKVMGIGSEDTAFDNASYCPRMADGVGFSADLISDAKADIVSECSSGAQECPVEGLTSIDPSSLYSDFFSTAVRDMAKRDERTSTSVGSVSLDGLGFGGAIHARQTLGWLNGHRTVDADGNPSSSPSIIDELNNLLASEEVVQGFANIYDISDINDSIDRADNERLLKLFRERSVSAAYDARVSTLRQMSSQLSQTELKIYENLYNDLTSRFRELDREAGEPFDGYFHGELNAAVEDEITKLRESGEFTEEQLNEFFNNEDGAGRRARLNDYLISLGVSEQIGEDFYYNARIRADFNQNLSGGATSDENGNFLDALISQVNSDETDASGMTGRDRFVLLLGKSTPFKAYIRMMLNEKYGENMTIGDLTTEDLTALLRDFNSGDPNESVEDFAEGMRLANIKIAMRSIRKCSERKNKMKQKICNPLSNPQLAEQALSKLFSESSSVSNEQDRLNMTLAYCGPITEHQFANDLMAENDNYEVNNAVLGPRCDALSEHIFSERSDELSDQVFGYSCRPEQEYDPFHTLAAQRERIERGDTPEGEAGPDDVSRCSNMYSTDCGAYDIEDVTQTGDTLTVTNGTSEDHKRPAQIDLSDSFARVDGASIDEDLSGTVFTPEPERRRTSNSIIDANGASVGTATSDLSGLNSASRAPVVADSSSSRDFVATGGGTSANDSFARPDIQTGVTARVDIDDDSEEFLDLLDSARDGQLSASDKAILDQLRADSQDQIAQMQQEIDTLRAAQNENDNDRDLEKDAKITELEKQLSENRRRLEQMDAALAQANRRDVNPVDRQAASPTPRPTSTPFISNNNAGAGALTAAGPINSSVSPAAGDSGVAARAPASVGPINTITSGGGAIDDAIPSGGSAIRLSTDDVLIMTPEMRELIVDSESSLSDTVIANRKPVLVRTEQEGVYIQYVPKLDADGNVVLDENGQIQYESTKYVTESGIEISERSIASEADEEDVPQVNDNPTRYIHLENLLHTVQPIP